MWDAVGIIGLLSTIVAVIGSAITAVKRKPIWKKWLAGAGVAFLVFIIGVVNASSSVPPEDRGVQVVSEEARGNGEGGQKDPSIPAISMPSQGNESRENAPGSSALDPNIQEQPAPKLTKVMVSRVVDGDTIEVNLAGTKEKIRLIGVDTPETVHPTKGEEPYGKEASDFTKSKLEGKTVSLEMDTQETDKYGRFLAYVWLENSLFNETLVREGYAQVYTCPPNIKYTERFTQAQKLAREENKGLWGLASKQEEIPASAPANVSTPAPQSTYTPEPAPEPQSVTVYITDTGSKYHRPGCRYLRRSCHPISLDDARAAGYVPCKVCRP